MENDLLKTAGEIMNYLARDMEHLDLAPSSEQIKAVGKIIDLYKIMRDKSDLDPIEYSESQRRIIRLENALGRFA